MTDAQGRLISPLPSSQPDAGGESDKENAPTEETQKPLPKQIADMLADITASLKRFDTDPPHTIQRLAELVLRPRAHYKALAPYLHAVDRVVGVTSGIDTFPLPPAIPDMSGMAVEGEEAKDPAVTVSWGNSTAGSLGSDDTLGGALLTPIPWLTKRGSEGAPETPGAQIHSEGTETIEGPNGVGSIETVSVSVNGIPSAGHTRGVTQGELLRQEQRAGVVPVSQLSRAQEAPLETDRRLEDDENGDGQEDEDVEAEEEAPHARGPEEIGVGDTGLQSATTSYVGEGGLETQGIDVEAAVGRKHEDDEGAAAKHKEEDTDLTDADDGESTSAESTGTKREGEPGLEGDAAKKVKEDDDKAAEDAPPESSGSSGPAEEAKEAEGEEGEAKKDDGDKMDTGK
jgi:hypothetical protein